MRESAGGVARERARIVYTVQMTPLMLIAGLIELSTAIPYIRDIRNGKTYPAMVSWITWFLLGAIAAGASFSDGAIASGIISGAIAVECLLIILFSLKKAQFTYSRFDAFCQLGALLGLLMWWWTKDPLVALIFFVVVDATGALPTFRHAWRKPREETLHTFSLSILGNSLALAAIPVYTVPEVIIPAYLLTLNTVLSGTILFRKRYNIPGT